MSDVPAISDEQWVKAVEDAMQPTELTQARAEIARLRQRLELTGDFADGPDGIECRNDTIKLLDEKVARQRAEIARLRSYLPENPEDVTAGIPDHIVEAGMQVRDRVNADHDNYTPGVTTDWDEGMVAIATFRAMLAAATKDKIEVTQADTDMAVRIMRRVNATIEQTIGQPVEGAHNGLDKILAFHRLAAQRAGMVDIRVAKLRSDIFEVLRQHDVSEQCFAEVAMITHAAIRASMETDV